MSDVCDIEDVAGSSGSGISRPVVNSKRKRGTSESANELDKSWREILGPPPPMGKPGEEREVLIRYRKKKWAIQLKQRTARRGKEQNKSTRTTIGGGGMLRANIEGFLHCFGLEGPANSNCFLNVPNFASDGNTSAWHVPIVDFSW